LTKPEQDHTSEPDFDDMARNVLRGPSRQRRQVQRGDLVYASMTLRDYVAEGLQSAYRLGRKHEAATSPPAPKPAPSK
jgi:hypothetical protein